MIFQQELTMLAHPVAAAGEKEALILSREFLTCHSYWEGSIPHNNSINYDDNQHYQQDNNNHRNNDIIISEIEL